MKHNRSWMYNFAKYSLISTLSLLWFSFFTGLLSFVFSAVINLFKLKSQILEMQSLKAALILGFTVFILAFISLFWADKSVSNNYESWEKEYGKWWLRTISIISFITLLILFYFSFSLFNIYITSTFWTN